MAGEPTKEYVSAIQSLLKSKAPDELRMAKTTLSPERTPTKLAPTTLAPAGQGQPIAKMPAEGEKVAESALSHPPTERPESVETDVERNKPTVIAPIAKSPATSEGLAGTIGPGNEPVIGAGEEDWSIPAPAEKPPTLSGQKPVSTPAGPNWAAGKPPAPTLSGRLGDITRAPKRAGFGLDPLMQSLARASLSIAGAHGGMVGKFGASVLGPLLGMDGGRKKKDSMGGMLAGLLGGGTSGLSEVLGGIGGHASGGNQQLMEAIQKLTEAVNELTEELQKGHKSEAAGVGPQKDGSFIPSLRQPGDAGGQKPPQWEGPHYAQGQSGNNTAQQMEILSTLTRLLIAV